MRDSLSSMNVKVKNDFNTYTLIDFNKYNFYQKQVNRQVKN